MLSRRQWHILVTKLLFKVWCLLFGFLWGFFPWIRIEWFGWFFFFTEQVFFGQLSWLMASWVDCNSGVKQSVVFQCDVSTEVRRIGVKLTCSKDFKKPPAVSSSTVVFVTLSMDFALLKKILQADFYRSVVKRALFTPSCYCQSVMCG